jgi:hypothetical protein
MTQLIDLGKIRFYFAGLWSDSATYELNDVVKYGGNVYVYTYALASTGNLPTNDNYWSLMIEGLKFTGAYNPTTEYRVGDGVAHGGKVYISIKTGSGKTPPNAEYWSQFADGIQYEGAFLDTRNYQKNDVVTYGGSVYIAKQDGVGNLPTVTAFWDEFVSGVDATGVWNQATQYKPNQLVAYGARIYIANVNNVNKVPSTNPTEWTVFVDGVRAMGTYNPATQYHINDIVVYGSTIYIAKGDTLGNTPSDTTYWNVLTSGFSYKGEWAPANEYLAGDVVNWGGSTYLTNIFHSSSEDFATDLGSGKWTKYNSGIRYRGAWAASTLYVSGDVISDGENARIAISDHTSGPFLVDDEEYWDILAKGATGLLPAQGGRAGYVLTTDGAEATFERDVTNLYFGDGARAFIEGDAALTDVALAAAWDTEDFAQSVVINNGDGAASSSDFIAYTTGSANDAGWADLGFTGPNFEAPEFGVTGPSDAYVFGTAQAPKVVTVSNRALSLNVVTITTQDPHGFTAGKTVDIAGIDATFNGRYEILATPTTTTFTYAKTAADVASAPTTGTATMYIGAGNLVLATGDTGSDNRIVLAAGGFASGREQMIIIPDTMVHIEIQTNSTAANNGALVVAGGAGITGDVNIAGDLSVLGNVDLQGVTKLPVGAGATAFETSAGLTDAVIIAAGDSEGYVQNSLVNLGEGASSSADYIAYALEGDNMHGWVDMGITNASFNDPTYGVTGPHDGYIFMSAPENTTGKGNLVIATDNTGTDNKIVFAAGGLGTGNEQMVITPNQNVHIEIETPSTSATTGAFTVVGGVGITGDMSFDGLLRTKGTIFIGEGAEQFESDADLTNAKFVANLSGGPYAQMAIHNPTSSASTDMIVYASNGDDVSGWIDMGITGSTFSQSAFGITGANDGYIFMEAPEGTTGKGNLVIATGDRGTENAIVFAAGGFASGRDQMAIYPDVNVHIEIATPSTSATTGALTVVGGVGIQGDMNIAGDVNIAGQITFGGNGTVVETENLAVVDPMIFVANGQTSGDNVDFAFLGQSRSARPNLVFGPYTTTNKSLTNNVATLVTGNVAHNFEIGDTVVVANVDTLTTYATAFPIVRARATENVTTDYVKNIVLVSRASNVATLTLDASHDYIIGESVVVAGADSGYNGTFTVTAVTSNTVSFANTGADDTANVSAGTTTVSRTVSTTFVTITTSEEHGFLTGETVVISGVASVMNGTFPIYDVPSTTTFRYVQTGPAQTPTSSTGSAQVERTVGATFNGTHVITAIPTTKSFSFAKTAANVQSSSTTKVNINYVTSWSITNGVATIVLTNPPTENIGDACVVQDVDPLINDTLTVTARSLVLPYTLSFEVPQDDVPSTTLVTTSQRTVTSRNRISNVSTLTLSANHDYIIGQQIVVAGVSASFNGTFIVTAIPAANKVSYAQTATNINETASAGTITTSKPNPGTTTQTLVDQGTATVSGPFRGSYTGLARDHETGHWWIFSGVETKPTSTIDFNTVTTNDLHIRDLYTTGGDIYSSNATMNLVNNTVTTLNIGGAATSVNIGNGSGTLTIANPTVVGTQTTQNLYDTVATTINFAGAATTLNIGSTSNVAQTINIGAVSTGSSTYNLATAATVSGATRTINVGTNGVSGSTTNVTIGSSAPQNATLTENFATVNMGSSVTTASTYNLGTGATANGVTKTVNLGTNGVSGSTTNVNIGSASATSTGTVTVSANTITLTGGTTVQVSQDPTAGVDLAVATKRYVDMRPTIITTSQTLVARGNLRTSGVQSTGNYFIVPASGLTLTLPASPALGDEIVLTDIAGTAFNTPVNIARNGQLIQGLAEDMPFNVNNASVRLMFSNTTYGWRIIA